MKHLTFADKTLFVDDETADALVEYAAVLGSNQSADTVRVRAVGGDGNEVDADFVLNAATNLMTESTNSSVEPPRNDAAVAYMRGKIRDFGHSPAAELEDFYEPDAASAEEY